MKSIPISVTQLFKVLFIAGVLLSGCDKKTDKPVTEVLNTSGIQSSGPYLTHDDKGNAVLCWTEQDNRDSLYRLKYAVYNAQSNKFSNAITVPVSAGCSTSPESMGKIAFKADGTVIAVFGKAFAHEKNPYAGAIYYSVSTDKGGSWSDARFLHSDTTHTYGRSFFDLARLKNGELAAVWLDGRYGKAIRGSALFFAGTEKGKGFGMDTCLDKGTCECCRTALLTDAAGNIHVAYRSIMFPSALSGKQVRDMVYKQSTDNGKTFSAAKPISIDNWEIDGCPHSGPTLAVANNVVNVVWFTAGGGSGLYHTALNNPASKFNDRKLLTSSGRHPQMIALPDKSLAMVCEENMDAETAPMHMEHSHNGKNMAMNHHAAAGAAKITLKMLNQGAEDKSINVTDGLYSDHHAVITAAGKDLLIAWIRENNGHSMICYAKINTTK